MTRRWLWRGLLGLATLVCLVLLAGAVYEWLSTMTAAPLRRSPGEMIAVNDHRLHLRCIGAGTPTVVLEHDRIPGELPAGISEDEFIAALQNAHARFAKASDAGRHLVLDDASHYDVGGMTPLYAERVVGELGRLIDEAQRQTKPFANG